MLDWGKLEVSSGCLDNVELLPFCLIKVIFFHGQIRSHPVRSKKQELPSHGKRGGLWVLIGQHLGLNAALV